MDPNKGFREIDPGHSYELANLGSGVQVLDFIKKAPGETPESPLVTVQDGTTNETVIRVLIARLSLLNGRLPSKHTEAAINHLEDAIAELAKRTADRVERGVEGTHEA